MGALGRLATGARATVGASLAAGTATLAETPEGQVLLNEGSSLLPETAGPSSEATGTVLSQLENLVPETANLSESGSTATSEGQAALNEVGNVVPNGLPTSEPVFVEPGEGFSSSADAFAQFPARSVQAIDTVDSQNLLKAQQLLANAGMNPSAQATVLDAFEPGGFRVTNTVANIDNFRYFDNVNAFAGGRWSTPTWYTTPAERISNLSLVNNEAMSAATYQIQPGSTVFEGLVALRPPSRRLSRAAATNTTCCLVVRVQLLRQYHDRAANVGAVAPSAVTVH